MDANYFSSTSWTSNRGASRLSFRSEPETIECQLDRLNQTLLGVLRYDEMALTDSFSFRGGENLESEDDMYDKLEGFIQKYDRALMVCEDFRSCEIRENSKKIQKVSLKDLYKFKETIESVIEKVELGIEEDVLVKLPTGDSFWKVVKEDLIPFKTQIAESFEKNLKKMGKIKEPLEDFSDLNLELLMMNSFRDSFAAPSLTPCVQSQFFTPKDLHSQISLEIEYKTLKASNNLKDKTIKDLEWEIVQTKMLKSNLDLKSKTLTEKEASITKQVKEIQSEFLKKQKTIDQEKTKTLEILQKFQIQQKKLADVLIELQKPKPNLKTEYSNILQNLTNTPKPCQEPCEKLDEFASIETQIHSLEQQLPSTQDKNALVFKINHLKTKLSTMRSAQALNVQNKGRRISTFCKSGNLTPKPEVRSDLISLAPKPRLHLLGLKATNVEIEQKMFTERETSEKSTEKEESLAKLLELKESRLRKREQEMFDWEIKLQNNWTKVTGMTDGLKNIKESMRYWKERNAELEKREKDVERLITENLELKKSVSGTQKAVEKLKVELEEKLESSEKVFKLLKDLEIFEL